MFKTKDLYDRYLIALDAIEETSNQYRIAKLQKFVDEYDKIMTSLRISVRNYHDTLCEASEKDIDKLVTEMGLEDLFPRR